MSKKKQTPKKPPGFTASFAVRLWVEVDDIQADTMEEAVAAAKTVAVDDVVDMCGGVTVIDSYIDVVQVTNPPALDKVSP